MEEIVEKNVEDLKSKCKNKRQLMGPRKKQKISFLSYAYTCMR